MKKLRALISVTLCLAMLFAIGVIPPTGTLAAENGLFKVGGAVFSGFVEAMDASAAAGEPAVLQRDAVLNAGEYTIPEGAALLIPDSDSDVGDMTVPQMVREDPSEAYVFRTLTLGSGAKLTVNGTLALSGSVTAADAGRSAAITGAYGKLIAQSGSSITVGSGGKLYAWGSLCGEGTVTALDGSAVFESVEIDGYAGDMEMLHNFLEYPGIFPFTRISYGTIEAPLTLSAGAEDNGCSYIRFMRAFPSLFVRSLTGENGMFSLGAGSSLTRTANASSGKTSLVLRGNISAQNAAFRIEKATLGFNDAAMPIPGTDIVIAGGELRSSLRLVLDTDSSLTVNSGASLVIDGGLYCEGGIDINGVLTVNGELGTVRVPVVSSAQSGSVCFNSVKAPVAERYNAGSLTVESVDCSAPDLKNADGSAVTASDRQEGTGYKMKNGSWQQMVTIDLVRADGESLGYTYAESGKRPVLPTPTDYYDEYYHYIFHFWKPALTPAVERTEYIAVYRKYLRTDREAKSRLRGDANGDGEVDILDATHIQRWLVGLDSSPSGIIEVLGDADGDGETTVLDATVIQRYLAGFQNVHRVNRVVYWAAPTETPVVNPTEAPTQAPTEAPTDAPIEQPTHTTVPTEPYELPVF